MRTNDRADLAVPTDDYPRPDSKILIRNSMCWSEDFKWVQYPFHDKTFPNVVVISFGYLLVDGYSAEWYKCSLLEGFFAPGFYLISCKLGDSAFLSRGCGLLFAGCWRRVLLERSKMIISISNFTRRLYHGYDGQLGTTMIPMAASKTNFI